MYVGDLVCGIALITVLSIYVSEMNRAELAKPIQYVLILPFLSSSNFFTSIIMGSNDLNLSSVLLNYYSMDNAAEDCQGIVKHDVIYTLALFQNPTLLSYLPLSFRIIIGKKSFLDGSQNFYCSFLLLTKAQSDWKL